MTKFANDQIVLFAGQPAKVMAVREKNGIVSYLCETNPNLPMWIPEKYLSTGAASSPPRIFNPSSPHLLVVDNFYKRPNDVREFALQQDFAEDVRYYKGKRSTTRLLFPYIREEFERLLGRRIVDWLHQPANGVFLSLYKSHHV